MATKPRSKKIQVVEYLYEKLSQGVERVEDMPVVTMGDVRDAIAFCNERYGLGLSQSNPANFMKDLIRGQNASRNWPESLTAQGIGGRQRVGEGRVFEFTRFEEGQTEAFASTIIPSADLIPTSLQSISLSRVARSLGRQDESWLIQVAVSLRLIEQHFATRKGEVPRVVEINHLQIGVKLAKSEVDALFLAVVETDDGRTVLALITCEAKQENERILEHQIVEQVVAANKSIDPDLQIGLIIPIAIKAMNQPTGGVYVAEFEPWTREQAQVAEDDLGGLVLASESLFQLMPAVLGIGTKKARRRTKPTTLG
ncbi:hypothetical protein AB4037_08360 [Labrys sp. KB_33_2]|uniref:hypothetical protein n=1 Tax=Labrys sp. KB_33_2 TaxID=3237479 RepID=UPI003F8F59C6